MSWTKQITIWCENCSEWDQLATTSVKLARKELKGKGWSSKGNKDYCPQCSQITSMYKKKAAPKKTKQVPDYWPGNINWPGNVEIDMKTRPGSPEAQEAGCTCPVLDNEHGLGRGGCGAKFGWYMVETCPIHGGKKDLIGEALSKEKMEQIMRKR